MKNLGKFLLPSILVLSAFLISPVSAKAAERCESQYGGGEICVKTGELQIDKEVWDPDSGRFVDNLGIQNHKFTTAEIVTFKLNIKNVGDETLHDIEVTDTLPDFLFFIEGETGSFKIDRLNPGESFEKTLKAQVKAESELTIPTVCVVNTAEARAGEEHDKDTAQICLTKKVLGITTLPKTGAGSLIYILIFTLFTGFVGLLLIRLNRKP